MENLTKEQKEQALQEFNTKKQRQYETGKIIIICVVISDILISALSAVANLNIGILIMSIVLSIMLFTGQPVIRYVFAVKSLINLVFAAYVLTSPEIILPTWGVVILMAQFAYCIAASVLLFASNCVSEYMYNKKNG